MRVNLNFILLFLNINKWEKRDGWKVNQVNVVSRVIKPILTIFGHEVLKIKYK